MRYREADASRFNVFSIKFVSLDTSLCVKGPEKNAFGLNILNQFVSKERVCFQCTVRRTRTSYCRVIRGAAFFYGNPVGDTSYRSLRSPRSVQQDYA